MEMSKVCNQCGYENDDKAKICEICNSDLAAEDTQSDKIEIQEIETEKIMNNSKYEYYVICPESQARTEVANADIKKFYCEGCKKEHCIDGFLWRVERKEKIKENKEDMCSRKDYTEKKSVKEHLYLEEINSHERICINKPGGTVGRYSAFGSKFFCDRNLLVVSGEHCSITYENDEWVLRHLSNTNDTKYNNVNLEKNCPVLLEDGKIITLANKVTFIVRMV